MKNNSNTFYLIRHAHAEFLSDENRPLSQSGEKDAGRVANILKEFPIDHIYFSPYRRALQTMESLAEQLGLDVQLESDLRERKLSDQPVKDFNNAVRATWQDFSFAHPGGESNAAAQMRGLNVIHRLQNQAKGKHSVISTHGNLLALILNGLDSSIGFDFWKSLTMPDIFKSATPKNGSVEIHRLWHDSES